MTKKAPDVKSWARGQTRRRGGRECGICANKEVAKACDDAGEVWAEERPDGMSFAAIAEMLGDLFGYSAGQGTVRNHFIKHRKELFRRIRGS
jgi:hypothetical protein